MASFRNPSVVILPGAVVSEKAYLKGEIRIGRNCIIHPTALILAEAGPIIIDDGCVIEEQATIVHRISVEESEFTREPLHIGPRNYFEAGCRVEAYGIGSNNVFESKCFVGCKVIVPNGCTIKAGCKLKGQKVLQDCTIVYGEQCLTRRGFSRPMPSYAEMESLKEVLAKLFETIPPGTYSKRRK